MTATVQFQYYNDFKKNIDELKLHALKDVEVVNSDIIKFKTDYDNNRVVVLTIPFDKGWKLKDEFNNDVELMQVNGGFLGFVAENGNHSYTLTYITPMLPFGLDTTFIGTLLVESYYVCYQLLDIEKRKRNMLCLANMKKPNKKNSPKENSYNVTNTTYLNNVIDIDVKIKK